MFDVWRHQAVGLNDRIDNKWRCRDKLSRERDHVEVVVDVGQFAAVSCLACPTGETFPIVADAAKVKSGRISEKDVRAGVQTLRHGDAGYAHERTCLAHEFTCQRKQRRPYIFASLVTYL